MSFDCQGNLALLLAILPYVKPTDALEGISVDIITTDTWTPDMFQILKDDDDNYTFMIFGDEKQRLLSSERVKRDDLMGIIDRIDHPALEISLDWGPEVVYLVKDGMRYPEWITPTDLEFKTGKSRLKVLLAVLVGTQRIPSAKRYNYVNVISQLEDGTSRTYDIIRKDYDLFKLVGYRPKLPDEIYYCAEYINSDFTYNNLNKILKSIEGNILTLSLYWNGIKVVCC